MCDTNSVVSPKNQLMPKSIFNDKDENGTWYSKHSRRWILRTDRRYLKHLQRDWWAASLAAVCNLASYMSTGSNPWLLYLYYSHRLMVWVLYPHQTGMEFPGPSFHLTLSRLPGPLGVNQQMEPQLLSLFL